MEFSNKVHDAAIRYLKFKGYTILDPEFYDMDHRLIVASDGRDIAFIDVAYDINDMPEELTNISRTTFEKIVLHWFQNTNDVPANVGCRFDTIDLSIVRNDRALLRHHTDVALED